MIILDSDEEHKEELESAPTNVKKQDQQTNENKLI